MVGLHSCCLLLPAVACCCLLLPAVACCCLLCLLLPAVHPHHTPITYRCQEEVEEHDVCPLYGVPGGIWSSQRSPSPSFLWQCSMPSWIKVSSSTCSSFSFGSCLLFFSSAVRHLLAPEPERTGFPCPLPFLLPVVGQHGLVVVLESVLAADQD